MQMLAMIFDALQIGNWQRGGGGEADRPEPFDRPGLAESAGGRVVDGEETDVDDMDEWLANRR